MIKPDMVVVGPNNIDYPPWRELVAEKRDLFGKVLNVIHEANRRISFTSFIQTASPEIQTIDMPANSDCWRHTTTNVGIDECTSDWILFYEQDFLPLVENFFEEVFLAAEEGLPNGGVVGFNYKKSWVHNERLHPAFLLISKNYLNQTTKNFRVAPGLDCFGSFSNELLNLHTPYLSLDDLNLEEGQEWYHWNGLTSNFSLVQSGGQANHQVAKFKEYVQRSLDAKVQQDSRFIKLCNAAMRQRED